MRSKDYARLSLCDWHERVRGGFAWPSLRGRPYGCSPHHWSIFILTPTIAMEQRITGTVARSIRFFHQI
jgi:hypothetical protein